MRRQPTLVAIVIALAAPYSVAFPAALTAQTAPQQFVVLQSQTLTVPFESLTNEQAHCSISGNANFATMGCQAPPGTAKASYHYVAILVVDQQGTAYAVACHQSLVDLWCKKLPAGVAIQANFDSGQKTLSILDGQKSHPYQTLTSAFVGPLQPGQPIPSAKRPKAAPQPNATPTNASAGAQAAATSNSNPPAAEPTQAAAPNSNAAACVPTTTSCAAFVSDPPSADIYVDGKFIGSTPSTLALTPGSHEIRIEADKFKPWTRTLESTAGSTVTIHAALAK